MEILLAILKSWVYMSTLFIELNDNLFISIPELSKIANTKRVSNPPVKSDNILLVCFFKERIIYPHLSIHLSIIFNPFSDSRGTEFSL